MIQLYKLKPGCSDINHVERQGYLSAKEKYMEKEISLLQITIDENLGEARQYQYE